MVNCGELDMELGSKAKDKEEEEEEEEEEMIEKEKEKEEGARVDYRERGQWLRAAILGANDGLVSTASLMMGVDAVKRDMLVSGLAGLVGGACSMAIGEFVSVSSQRDAHLHHLQQQQRQRQRREEEEEEEENKDKDKSSIGSRGVPNPMQAACASALSFAVGAAVPLVAASFVLHNNTLRLVLLVGVSSLALLIFGGTGAYLGRGPILKSCIRVLLAGWAAMLITYALLALFGHTTAL